MKPETILIKEGVRAHFLPDYKFKTFRLSVFFHCPLLEETASLDTLLPSVLKRGTKKYPSAQALSMELEENYGASLGGSVTKRGDSHVISFHFEGVASEFLPEERDMLSVGCDLLEELLFHPNCDGAFPEDIVRQEKENLKKDIEGLVNDKRSYAVFRAVQEMFRGEPYGVCTLGDIERVNEITGETLFAHYENVLRDCPVDIFAVGNFNPAVLTEKVKAFCENLKARNGCLTESKKAAPATEMKKVEESMNIVQGKLVIGFTTEIGSEDPLYFPGIVMNSIFGSGTHSKLFNNVREKLSLAYYAASRTDKFKGVLLVDSGIEFGNFEKATDEIFCQLEEVKKGNITDTEFSSAVESLANSYRSMKDSMQAMESFAFGQIHQSEILSPDEAVEKLREVTLEQVIEAANKVRPSVLYFLKD